MSLDTIITNLLTVVDGIDEIKRVYADPPESINEFPSAMVYGIGGDLDGNNRGNMWIFHNVVLDIYSSRTVLPQAVDEAKQWPGLVYPAFMADCTLSNSVDAVDGPISYRLMPMRYNDLQHFGARFTFRFKTITAY